MIKKILLIFSFFFTVVLAQAQKPMASIEPEEYNFGTIKEGETASHDFTILNSGDDTLKILDVRASCGCTAVKPEKSSLPPGESTLLHVTFNSKGKHGKQTKIVYVKTNDPKHKIYRTKFIGEVVVNDDVPGKSGNEASEAAPKIFFPVNEHNFGKVQEGEVVNYTFKISNKGKDNLEIKNVKTSCGCTAALIDDKIIEPGKEEDLKVELNTKNRSGKLTRTITVTSNDPAQPVKTLTIYADVTKGK